MKNKTRRSVKWALYLLFAVILLCFQCAPQKTPLFEGTLFLLPLAVSIACFEKLVPVAVMGAACGFLWDYSARCLFGFHALVLCVLCVAVSLVLQFLLRSVVWNHLLCIAVGTALYELVFFFFFRLLPGSGELWKMLYSHCLPVFFKTILFGAAIYFVVRKIYRISPSAEAFGQD